MRGVNETIEDDFSTNASKLRSRHSNKHQSNNGANYMS